MFDLPAGLAGPQCTVPSDLRQRNAAKLRTAESGNKENGLTNNTQTSKPTMQSLGRLWSGYSSPT